jgi:hypothetical protein
MTEEEKVSHIIDVWCEKIRVSGQGYDIDFNWVEGVCVVDVTIYPIPSVKDLKLGFRARGVEHVVLGENIEFMLKTLADGLEALTP